MTKALPCAIHLLARREHSAEELATKLQQKGYENGEIKAAITECQRLDLQSDARFATQLTRIRIRQGYGPLRIQRELQTKGISCELIEQILAPEKNNWVDYAFAVWQKKYGKQANSSLVELQKQQRFLLYRGFPSEIVRKIDKSIIL